jgi:hypothetical protein
MMAVMAIAALSSSAGAAAPTYSVSANGGFISLSALNLIGLTGAGSSSSAGSGAATTASGTGLCLTVSVSSSTCPNTTNASSSDVINTTANASAASGPGTSSNPAAKCLIPPLSLVLVSLQAACGTASASNDTNGMPTATGEGNLAKLTVGLGALPGAGSLLGNGTLCGSSSSLNSSTGASTGLVSSLLGAVNSLLSVTGKSPLANSTSSPLDSVCSILSGLTSQLPLVGGLLSNATASTNLLTVNVGDSTSSETTSTAANGDTLVTSTATTQGVEVNLLNLVDVKLLPNTVSVTMDTTTGLVTSAPTAVTGVLSIQAGSSAPSTIALPDLSSVLSNLLNSLGLSGLINPTLTTVAESSTTWAPDHTSASAESADLKLDLLDGLVVLNLGDAKVSASGAATESPAVITSPSVAPPAAAPAATAAAVVPGVTTVHTGEFWAGSLAPILAGGMVLAGVSLVARRRILSMARSVLLRRHR